MIHPTPEDITTLRGKRILLVDDDPDQVLALGEILVDEGMLVSIAVNGADALASAERTQPDLAVVDYKMPGMSGLDLIDRLWERLPDLPVVMLTGYPKKHLGVDPPDRAYIAKPVDLGELFAKMASLVK